MTYELVRQIVWNGINMGRSARTDRWIARWLRMLPPPPSRNRRGEGQTTSLPGRMARNESNNRASALAPIVDREISGQYSIAGPAFWNDWTPSGGTKMYNYLLTLTKYLWDGTLFTIGESEQIIGASWKGSYFEAYSAQKFAVTVQGFLCDKDNVVASAEAAWVNPSDPRSVLKNRHTNIHTLIGCKTIQARPIDSSMWYVKIDLHTAHQRVFNKYRQVAGGKVVNPSTYSNSEPYEGYVECQIMANTTESIYYAHRTYVQIVTANLS